MEARSGPVGRTELVDALARLVAGRCPERVLRVAVDGPDAAGKTTLADELAEVLAGTAGGAASGAAAPRRAVVRAGVDGFHRPRAERLERGSLSPEGYYRDSFDYGAVRRELLDPLGPGGSRRYRPAVFDHRTDSPVRAPARVAPEGAALLFDGVFLLRPELRAGWDLTVYLAVGEAETLRRALVRDADLLGGPEVVRERYARRYLPGQRLYRAEADPEGAADMVVDHGDPARPRVVKWAV